MFVKLIPWTIDRDYSTEYDDCRSDRITCGVYVFYRKLITFILLGLYGVPAAIGPHWHNHSRCDHLGAVCESASTSQSVTESSSAPAQCACHHSVCSQDTASHSGASTQVVASGSDCDSCSICRFYSCTPLIELALSTPFQGSLVEFIAIALSAQPLDSCQLHFARGPPV